MVTPLKNVDSLDSWIRAEAFKYAYNEKTRGFIGKKYIKERVATAVPREFIAMGHTREKVALRLNEMLADDLTQDLLRDCSEKKRINAGELEASTLRKLLKAPSSGGLGITGDKGALAASVDTTPGSPTGGIHPVLGNFGTGIYIPSLAGTGARGVGGSGASSGVASVTYGMRATSGAVEKGKKPMTATVEDEVEGKETTLSIVDEPNRKPIPANTALPMSVSDGDRAIADSTVGKLPGLSEMRLGTTPKPDVVDDAKDIFSRGGSTPQRSRSPASSILISPPPPLDPDIPSLPFKLQHRILITLQDILEGACYNFAREHYPDFLARKGWDCPEAGELTHWTRGLSAEFRENPTKAVRKAEHFPLALKGIDEIGHSAVHRVPVSGRDIQRLIERARVFLHMLDATKQMRDQVDEINEIIERNILIVQDKRRQKEEKLRQELEKLEEWKRKLEHRVAGAIRQAEHEEERIQKSFRDKVGQALEALGTWERGAYNGGTDVEVELETSSICSTMEEEGEEEGEELARPQAGVKLDVEGSALGQEEEDFHEPEGWPIEGEYRGEI